MTESDTSDTLAPLRSLVGPDQVAVLRAECTDLGRRVVQLTRELVRWPTRRRDFG